MLISVVGMDPSLRNWGIAEATLDLDSGRLSTPELSIVQPKEETSKQVRKNSKDLEISELLYLGLVPCLAKADIVFVEVPVGSQSARAMASYGICVGLLGALRGSGKTLIEVTALEVKQALTGKRDASKGLMIQKAQEFYPDANWPLIKGVTVASKAEHMADAIGAIHAGVKTPLFRQLQSLQIKKEIP